MLVGKLVRANRRLQTWHVREIYTLDVRESFNRVKAEADELFWRKKKNKSKGLMQASRGPSTKKAAKLFH